jgi:hypothetical protein
MVPPLKIFPLVASTAPGLCSALIVLSWLSTSAFGISCRFGGGMDSMSENHQSRVSANQGPQSVRWIGYTAGPKRDLILKGGIYVFRVCW